MLAVKIYCLLGSILMKNSDFLFLKYCFQKIISNVNINSLCLVSDDNENSNVKKIHVLEEDNEKVTQNGSNQFILWVLLHIFVDKL